MRISWAVVAALRRECRYILRGCKKKASLEAGSLQGFLCEYEGEGMVVVVCGMGEDGAEACVKELLREFSPKRLVLMGYGGGLHQGLECGELLVAHRILHLKEGSLRPVSAGKLLHAWEAGISGALGGFRWMSGSFVCVREPVPKAALKEKLRGEHQPAVVEMESAGVARAMSGTEIPWIGLRVVLDDLQMEPQPVISRWIDENKRIRPSLMIMDLLGHPSHFPMLMRLYWRARMASLTLGLAVDGILRSWSSRCL
jgi:adenosylhomocysteine nucleosidase